MGITKCLQNKWAKSMAEQAWRKLNCIGLAFRYLYPTACIKAHNKAKGVWGHAPQENFMDVLRSLLRPFLGLKHHLKSSL